MNSADNSITRIDFYQYRGWQVRQYSYRYSHTVEYDAIRHGQKTGGLSPMLTSPAAIDHWIDTQEDH